MKTLFIFAICLVCISGYSQNAKVIVPDAVKSKFNALYPNAGKTEWEAEDGVYEASFKENNLETSVLIVADGTVAQTEREITLDKLPSAVREYIAGQISGKKITSAEKITNFKGVVTYEVDIDNADYLFDSNGHFLGMDNEEEDDDNDDK
ncbi:MAG TPA: hypothetical protein VMZ69_06275 [Saprospiraceae bacterium]|nr:hypothetical protein [Saprospiraceae bacterium]